MSSSLIRLLTLGVAFVAAPVLAQSIEGEVRRIDKPQQKITLAHGEIRNLDMPAMTMTFRVKDTAMLDGLQVGDKVRFNAEQIGGQLTVTALRKP